MYCDLQENLLELLLELFTELVHCYIYLAMTVCIYLGISVFSTKAAHCKKGAAFANAQILSPCDNRLLR